MRTRIGSLEVSYSARGNPTYRIEVWHEGLLKHREIKGSEREVVRRKATMQAEEWDARWEQAAAQQSTRKARADEKLYRDNQKAFAAQMTIAAQTELKRIEGTLAHTLSVDDAVDWERLKDNKPFSEPRPERPKLPREPDPPTLPREPRPTDTQFRPSIGLLDYFSSTRRAEKEVQAAERFRLAQQKWAEETERLNREYQQSIEAHRAQLAKLEQDFNDSVKAWETRGEEFATAQQAANAAIDRQRERYRAFDPEAVEEYFDLVLSASDYPDWMPKEFDLDYTAENQTLVVRYALPPVEALPRVREVAYNQSRDEFTEKTLSDAQLNQLYDNLVYQITLRTVHEIFEADRAGAVAAVVFNGCVTSMDRTKGHEITACILSLQARRDEFSSINLANVDPKACFKVLKGVGSSKLHSLTPVAPIMDLRREDGRFVAAREVAASLDESVNLAAMDWEDFEHLVRELFEQEFRFNGGEVRITQASRDGGVDAIAFDPDPIRGGKIVIQAKRYTNTVGVAAVRDLFGTVHNEGATKGILVTTSDFGPDAYSFAKDKPLVLLSGANLLHLLEKHGHKAHIDLKEARGQPG